MNRTDPKRFALKDAAWHFPESDDSVLNWARDRVREWIPRLTGAEARMEDAAGDAAVAIVVGTPENQPAIGEAVRRGVLDLADLGEDDFVLKACPAGEPPTLYVAARTSRGAVYGVCELFERMGCTFLISGDRFPALDRECLLPFSDAAGKTDCAWRGIWFGGYCFAANAMFSLPDYEAMFDQMLKMKMNRIIFYHFPQEPFIDFTFRGERRLVGDISHPDSGYISYGREFTGSWRVADLPVGREKFDRAKIAPNEFQDLSSSAEALDTAKAFMRRIIALARERGIGVWMTFLPQFTTPNFSKYTRPMSRPHNHWSVHLSCTDPQVGPLNRAQLQGILEAYPDLEGIFLGIPEGFFDDPYPETEALIRREWDNYAEALTLMREHWGRFWVGSAAQEQHMRADIAFTEIVKTTLAEARDLKPDLKLGICTICKAYLLSYLHTILPPDMPFVDIESRALWTLDGAPLHLFQRMKGRACAIIPRAVDDGSLAGMQFPLWQYSQDRFLESAGENGTAGLMIQTTHIRGNEHSLRYLADGMWGGPREPGAFYREYARRIFGEPASGLVERALAVLEENDEALGGRGQGNFPWNMLPQQIGILQSFRDSKRPFDQAPFPIETVKAFEKKAELFTAAIDRLTRALAWLEAAEEKAPSDGQADLAYIVSRTKGYRAHLQALVELTGLYRAYYELFQPPRGNLPLFKHALDRLVGDAARLEARTRESAGHFSDCVSHTTDLAVLWMVSHKMVLGSQCLRQYLLNIQAFYEGRDYWTPVPWDKLFGRSVYPTYTLDALPAQATGRDYEPG